MKLDALKGKKILILGFGIEGKATETFLRRHFPDIQIDIADVKDGLDYLDNQNEYDLAIKSPGIKKEVLTIPYTTATNIFFANVKGMTIGVTGSKGKSTTASLIYSILKKAGKKVHLVGNIGKPMLLQLLKSNNKADIFVCELSSFQLAELKYSPHISVILNLYPGHMDYHGDIKQYYEAKKNIVAKATNEDFFIYNPAFKELEELPKETKAKAVSFIEELPFDEEIIPLLGKHNVDNVRAAVTVAHLLNVEDKLVAQAVQWFKPLNHRLELVGTFKGITFYDDAIATIPEATIAAIETLGNIGTIFLGGSDRGYDFSLLVDTIIYRKIHRKISNIVLFPDTGKKIRELLEPRLNLNEGSTLTTLKMFEANSMEEAVKFAYANTSKGTICLLSTACPSFSLWKNFEEKGDLFQKFVKKYGK